MNVLALEFRRSTAKWLAPIVAVTLVCIGILGMRPGLVLWSDVDAGLTQAGVIVNPIIAGFVAWEAGRRRRGGFEARLEGAVRNPLRARSAHLVAVYMWLALSGLVALAALWLWLSSRGVYGVPILPWLLTSGLGTLVAATLGYVIGTALNGRWFVPPAVAILVYMGWIAINSAHAPYWLIQAYPTVLNGSNVFVRYVWGTLIGQSVWYVALIVGLLCLLPLFSRDARRVRLALLIPTLALAVSGITILVSTGGQLTEGHNSRDFVCRAAPVDMCVNQAYRSGLPQLEQAFDAFNTRVAGTALVATRLEQNEMGVGDEPSAGARSLYVESLGSGFANDSLLLYEQRYGGIQRCTEATAANLHTIIDSWMLGQASPLVTAVGTPEGDAALRFSKLSDGQRLGWLQANLKAVVTCQLTPAAMP